MNSHLNIYRTYTDINRNYQLENDLTRALAISLQEDSLLFHEVLRTILGEESLNNFYNDYASLTQANINIQVKNSTITQVEQVYAVSLSEFEMTTDEFWNQNHLLEYDSICDIVIRIDNIAIIIEAKRDYVNCTAQLYNQAYNIFKNNLVDENKDQMKDKVIPVDLNWSKLMQLCIKVNNVEQANNSSNRFLKDFIDLIYVHNHTWFPEVALSSVFDTKSPSILRRIETAINELCKIQNLEKLDYSDRLGIRFTQPWAQEILFSLSDNGDLVVAIYPGNTKQQGTFIFNQNPSVKSEIQIEKSLYGINQMYHVKFSSFQRYFTGLWFYEDKLEKPLYTKDNFWKYCGRNSVGKYWDDLETLFNDSFKPEFDWKAQSKWGTSTFSNKTQFDLSFGYELSCVIPFETLRKIDVNQKDISALSNYIHLIYKAFETIYE